MKLAIMQPYFMPYLGYFQAIAAVDKYILYDQLTFIQSGWINKNRIRQRNMPVSNIVVPLVNKSSNTLIANTLIDNSKPWQNKILKALKLGYGKSAYYSEIMPLMEEILTREYKTISELNAYSIKRICEYLEIQTEIDSNVERYLDLEKRLCDIENCDYSRFMHLHTMPVKKVARVLEICKAEESNFFVNAIGGQELYDKAEFKQYGIDLFFIKMNSVQYSQNCKDGSFEPGLSIIDVLMHNGKGGTKQLLNEYTLI
jgi:hypothetical protein